MERKLNQLGMNPATASGRLVKDLLFDFVTKARYVCYRCKNPLTRDTFSIEHIVPWLDSDDPLALFFNLDNVAYSHLSCNVGASRKSQAPHGSRRRNKAGCNCSLCAGVNATYVRSKYTTEARRIKHAKEKLK